jgi:hypothetical protein
MPTTFKPTNDLERVLLDAQEGRQSVTQLVTKLLSSQVFVLSDKDPGPSNVWDNSPSLLVLNGSAGAPMLAIFTSPERSSEWPTRFPQFAFGLLADFRWLLKGVASGVGIVINPGSSIGLEMPPSGVLELKADTNAHE